MGDKTRSALLNCLKLYLLTQGKNLRGKEFLINLERRYELEQKLSDYVNKGKSLHKIYHPRLGKDYIPSTAISYCFSWYPLRRFEDKGEYIYSREGAFDAAILVSRFLEDIKGSAGKKLTFHNDKLEEIEGHLPKNITGDLAYYFSWEKSKEKWKLKVHLDKEEGGLEYLSLPSALFFRASSIDEDTKKRVKERKSIFWLGHQLYEGKLEHTCTLDFAEEKD